MWELVEIKLIATKFMVVIFESKYCKYKCEIFKPSGKKIYSNWRFDKHENAMKKARDYIFKNLVDQEEFKHLANAAG